MPYAESAGANIYFETQGSGDAILFAHGAGGNAGIWFEQIAAFSDRYQCIAFDHRTFARSPADPATISPAQYRDDALAVLDAAGVEQAHVVAQSMGGWTTMRLLLDVPARVRSVVMSATPGGLENRQPTESARNLTSSTDQGTSGVMATMSKATAKDPSRMQLYQAINTFNTEFAWTNLRSLGGAEFIITRDMVADVVQPVLFVAGDEDPLFPADLLGSYVSWFPDARLEVVKDAGHSPYFEQPAVFNRLLDGFLTRGNG
ncbi:MAG: alpha/beta hydrolase [Gammaproteobacteria bacterium]|nr:MAG: alpha/beta hydrolase [Gammaproteobacteria bacterium]